VPHIAVAGEVAEQAAPTKAARAVPFWKKRIFQIAAAAVVLLGGAAAFFLLSTPPPPPPPPPKAKVAPKTAQPGGTAATTQPKQAPTPPAAGGGDAQKGSPQVPTKAVTTTKETVTKREGSGQGKEAVGGIIDPDKPAVPDKPAASTTTSVATSLAPGVTAATTDVQAAVEASAPFRAFIANAKITGLLQGTSPRVFINGRTRLVGDVVDSGLGITFEGYDADKKLLQFKDKTGALVTRRYP
jgi:hypothetical protein